MNRAGYLLLSVLLLLALGPAQVLAADPEERRPRLEDFASYTAYLQALQTFDQRQAERSKPAAARAKASPAISPLPLPVPEGVDPASESAPPPLMVTGPEDMERAVELARSISHPEYVQRIRYNRTTHLSFPLSSIGSQDMSQSSVNDALAVEGNTEEERAASLKQLSDRLEYEQRLQLDKPLDGPVAGTRGPAERSVEPLSGGNGNGTVSITVQSR
ncbi:MAG: hypothetical protein Q8J78_07910 [Moraxellaceae bacterium]|nr:hypothetical protein [Moraxellaceae bacterium]